LSNPFEKQVALSMNMAVAPEKKLHFLCLNKFSPSANVDFHSQEDKLCITQAAF